MIYWILWRRRRGARGGNPGFLLSLTPLLPRLARYGSAASGPSGTSRRPSVPGLTAPSPLSQRCSGFILFLFFFLNLKTPTLPTFNSVVSAGLVSVCSTRAGYFFLTLFLFVFSSLFFSCLPLPPPPPLASSLGFLPLSSRYSFPTSSLALFSLPLFLSCLGSPGSPSPPAPPAPLPGPDSTMSYPITAGWTE